LDAL
jgi:hypothetical protein